MKRVICILFALLMLCSMSAAAVEPIDPEYPSSLTLQYVCNGEAYAGLQVETYRIARVFADGTFQLTESFENYPVNIHGITAQSQWQEVTSTLAGYIRSDGVAPDLTGTTDAAGTVSFTDILPGMYLTLSVQDKTPQRVTTFESFLTVIPQTTDGENHQYHVTAIPKCETFVPTPDTLEYQVVKQWKDPGHMNDRPVQIQVAILRDGQRQSLQTLSAQNNWTYRWTAPNDGAQWQVVEQGVPAEYSVTVTKTGTTFLLTNTHKDPYEDPPKTGDTTVLWPYMLAMCGSGILLVVLGLLLWRKKK